MKKNKFFGVIESFSRYEFKYILSKNKADKIALSKVFPLFG